jgi:hypothetical protein
MPWQECSVMDEKLQFCGSSASRRADGGALQGIRDLPQDRLQDLRMGRLHLLPDSDKVTVEAAKVASRVVHYFRVLRDPGRTRDASISSLVHVQWEKRPNTTNPASRKRMTGAAADSCRRT